MIPNFTIYSDRVSLTAKYYMEYLGFTLLYKVEQTENDYVWLEKYGQFLLIWPWNNKLGIARPVEFEVPDIVTYFSDIQEYARINEPLNHDPGGNYIFSIFDCENNLVYFRENPSLAVYKEELLQEQAWNI